VVSESLARRFFPGRDPVGERIKIGAPQETAPWLTIVGVVGDVRQTWFGPDLKPAIYVAYAQAPVPAMSLVLRSRLDAAALHDAVRQVMRDVAPDVPLGEVISMGRVVEESFWKNRLYAVMFAFFGAVALVLASVGAYALVSYVVALRRREIAIRMALGASPEDVLLLAVSQGMRLAMTGLALGVAAAFGVVRLMKSLLFDIAPTDPITFLWVPALLTTVAAVACLIPAWRARRVDPTMALRA
jgi:putative ABC transport system permease protein